MNVKQARQLRGLALSLVLAPAHANADGTNGAVEIANAFRLKERIWIGAAEVGFGENGLDVQVTFSQPAGEDMAKIRLLNSTEDLGKAIVDAGFAVIGHYHGYGQYIPCHFDQIVNHAIPGLVTLPEPIEHKLSAAPNDPAAAFMVDGEPAIVHFVESDPA